MQSLKKIANIGIFIAAVFAITAGSYTHSPLFTSTVYESLLD
jgi:hypothetical protein